MGRDRQNTPEEKGLLWKTLQLVVEQLDTPGVEEKIRRLRDENKGIGNRELVGMLIREKALYSGLIGGMTALPANIPIIGTIATLTLGTALDLAALIRYQCYLIIEVGAVYDRLGGRFQSMIDILSVLSAVAGDKRSRKELDRIRLSSVGDSCFNTGSRQLLNKVATRLGLRLVQKSSARAVPVIGAVVGAGINYSALNRTGRTARLYYEGRGR